jgi:hypothetical protein
MRAKIISANLVGMIFFISIGFVKAEKYNFIFRIATAQAV